MGTLLRNKLARMVVVASMAALMLLGFTTALVPSQSAHAATCSRSGCEGKDPASTGCATDSYTAAFAYVRNQQNQTLGVVQLRYSPSCGTNWTRVTSYVGTRIMTAFVRRIADGHREIAGGPYTVVWSPMIYSPGARTAYGYASIRSQDGTHDEGYGETQAA